MISDIGNSVLWCAFGLYCLNIAVGIIAHLRLYHFGRAHHTLYFIVVVSAVLTTVLAFHPALLFTLLALSYMPKSRPGTWIHPLCAALGLLGYVLRVAVFFAV